MLMEQDRDKHRAHVAPHSCAQRGAEHPCSELGQDAVIAVQSLSHVQLSATPWSAAHQAPLSFTISWSLLKLTSIELVMPANRLILCRPLLPLLSIFLSIRVFFNESAPHMGVYNHSFIHIRLK